MARSRHCSRISLLDELDRELERRGHPHQQLPDPLWTIYAALEGCAARRIVSETRAGHHCCESISSSSVARVRSSRPSSGGQL